MSIYGIGIDVVDIGRFQESVERTPNLIDRLFTESEARDRKSTRLNSSH